MGIRAKVCLGSALESALRPESLPKEAQAFPSGGREPSPPLGDSPLVECWPPAGVAQSAERLHGKEEVRGSIPRSGSDPGPRWCRRGIAAGRLSARSRRGSSVAEQAAHNRCVGGSIRPPLRSHARRDPGVKETDEWARRSSSGTSRT